MAEPAAKRKPGRPRDAGADRRILAAARAVAGEVGIHGASMSAIADRSSTGKPTIYLRWPDRRHVMAAAIADLDGGLADPPGETFRDALQAALLEDRELLVTGPESRFLRSALFESATDELIAESLDDRILGPRRDRLRRILQRGITEGDAREDLDAEAFADLLITALVRAMVLHGEGADPAQIAHHVGLALSDGVAAER
jgi:AcrR family transcriptional regulator